MGYQQALENSSAALSVGTAAVNTLEEIKTYLVASQTGSTTITEGEVMSWDTTSYGGAVRTNVVKRAASATDFVRGVALETKTIGATTAAGDRFVPIQVLRRGVKFNCAVADAATAGQIAIPSATAGRGAGAAVGTASNVGYGICITDGDANNLATLFVNAQF